jgi:hypothetical protein
MVPAVIGFESTTNLLNKRFNMPKALPKLPVWTNRIWFFLITPSLVLVLIFGALIVNNAQHFRTAHGVSIQSLYSHGHGTLH